MTSIQQLKEKHFNCIDSSEKEEIKHSAIYYIDKEEAANKCSNISIQFAIECLENILFTDNVIDFDDPNLNNDIASMGLNKINELKQVNTN